MKSGQKIDPAKKRDFKRLLQELRALSPEERKKRALGLAKALARYERRRQKGSM